MLKRWKVNQWQEEIKMICPNCGFNLEERRLANFTPMIHKLVKDRGQSTQKVLKTIITTIREYHPIRAKDIYFFLDSIREVEDRVIRYTINQYFVRGHYLKKGLPYLKAMIINHEKNKDKLREVEKRIHDTKPPYREI